MALCYRVWKLCKKSSPGQIIFIPLVVLIGNGWDVPRFGSGASRDLGAHGGLLCKPSSEEFMVQIPLSVHFARFGKLENLHNTSRYFSGVVAQGQGVLCSQTLIHITGADC